MNIARCVFSYLLIYIPRGHLDGLVKKHPGIEIARVPRVRYARTHYWAPEEWLKAILNSIFLY